MFVVAVKEDEVTSNGVLEELKVENYLSELGSYYFPSVYYKVQAGLAIYFSGEVGIK